MNRGTVKRVLLEILLCFGVSILVVFSLVSNEGTVQYVTALTKEQNNTTRWPRVFCMINTIPSRHTTRVRAVNETWIKHCDGYVYTTVESNQTTGSDFWVFKFPSTKYKKESREWLWDRVKTYFRRLYLEKLDHYDWFLKADDDTFYIIENLKEHLVGYSPSDPYYMGAFQSGHHGYASGGSGYIMSRAAVSSFVEGLDDAKKCRQGSYKHEDTEISDCMYQLNVKKIDPNTNGPHQMLPINLLDIISPVGSYKPSDRGWLLQSSVNPLTVGPSCCSNDLISTHYVTEPHMYTYYHLVYNVKVAGKQR